MLDLSSLTDLGLPAGVFIGIVLVSVFIWSLNKLKEIGVGGFVSEQIKAVREQAKDTIDFSQEEQFFKMDAERQDALALLQVLTGQLNEYQKHMITSDNKWHEKHDDNYKAMVKEISDTIYLAKQTSEKLRTLVTVTSTVYDGFKDYRKDELEELRTQLQQALLENSQQRERITALESELEYKHKE